MNRETSRHTLPNGTQIVLVEGSIVEERVDAIVNAANSHLQHGGGVALAISRAGGPSIQRESNAVGFVPVGQAAVTGAGSLPCRFVIHAVGPQWGEGDEPRKLASAAGSALAAAEERGLASISLPAISSGIYGYPKSDCARVLLSAAAEFAEARPRTTVREIRFCLYDAPTIVAFRSVWRERFEGA